MQALLTLLLRSLLLLALWPGVQAWAQASGGDGPCVRHGKASVPAAVHDSARFASAGHAPLGSSDVTTASVPARAQAASCSGHADGGAHPDCCQGGACDCRCGSPAVAAIVYLATPVPVSHDPVVARFDYQPSHLLPQPYRPPIA